MHIGVTVRNMGPQSTPEIMQQCVLAAEQHGLESVWITDHIAIPPDDAEGSGGRYTDTLTTLAWMAGLSRHIKLGSGVLILPYRAPLPTAKQVATIQELSAGRLLLGVGIGWMDPEFKALGIDRHRRGEISDGILAFLEQCFEHETVVANGQEFLFKPRPARPPVLIGGRAPHAIRRALRYGDGWMPMAQKPEQIEADVAAYFEEARATNAQASVTVMGGLPSNDAGLARQTLAAYADMGVERFVCAMRYSDVSEYLSGLDRLASVIGG